jgi:hypothetical protein
MDKIHALSQAILRSLHEHCNLPILRLTYLLPLVTISVEAQPIRTFPVSEGHMLRYSRIQFAVPAMRIWLLHVDNLYTTLKRQTLSFHLY